MIKNQNIENIEEKLSKIKLVAFDVDGVLTNGEIIYSSSGEELKIFNAKDGQGIALLKKNGFVIAIITARESIAVDKRAKDLDIVEVYQGIKNKFSVIQLLMDKYNINLDEIAYVGDDLPDLCVLKRVGVSFCPYDAVDEVKEICNFISVKKGGKGAVRQITDFLISKKTLSNKVEI
jgi:YrbI family 3-deoxy-D-manno-octulosonate 8-phosphate phosphatase